MKKLVLFAIPTLFLCIISNSQSLLWERIGDAAYPNSGRHLHIGIDDKIYVGAHGSDIMSLICYDKEGNIEYISKENDVWSFAAMKPLSNGRICQIGSKGSPASSDALLKVYNSNGSTYFKHTFNYMNGSDRFTALDIDNEDNIYVCGRSYNTEEELNHATTLKYNKHGVLQWTQAYTTQDTLYEAHHINANDAGDVFTIGTYDISYNLEKLFILHYDEDGAFLNEYTIDLNGYETVDPHFSLLDNGGNLYIGASAQKDSEPGTGLLLKFTSGSLVWTQRISPESDASNLFDAAFDSNGNIICAGAYQNSNINGYFVKFSPSGEKLQEGIYNTPSSYETQLYEISMDENYYYLSGYTAGENSFDIVTIKLNTQFELIWDIVYNNSENSMDATSEMKLDSEGNIILSGTVDIFSPMSKCITLKYSNPLGIYELGNFESSKIDVYPNPAGQLLYFQLDAETDDARYMLSNIYGQIVQSSYLSQAQDNQISLSGIIPGTYFLQILDGKKQYIAKFVKN